MRFDRRGVWRLATFGVLPAFLLLQSVALSGAQTSGAPDAREIEFGKQIFKTKARCQFCHKWDGSGDQGYGGNALSLRKTQLTADQVATTVQCGRPGTEMPYHDKFAYTDKRCYGMTAADVGDNKPQEPNQFLQKSEIEAVVAYLFTRVVGKGPATYEDCVDFWGTDTRECEPMKK